MEVSPLSGNLSSLLSLLFVKGRNYMDTRFTYKNFAIDGIFTLLDPIFQVRLLLSILFLVIVIFKKVSLWFCLLFARLTVIVSGQLLWFSAIIVDELNLGGSSTDTYIFLGTVIIQCAVVYIALIKTNKNKKNTAMLLRGLTP